MKKRMITEEVLRRVKLAEDTIFDLMKNSGESIIEPDVCIEVLVESGFYNYDSKRKAHYFREDLRNLRENNKLDIFTKISVTQDKPGRPWIISIK